MQQAVNTAATICGSVLASMQAATVLRTTCGGIIYPPVATRTLASYDFFLRHAHTGTRLVGTSTRLGHATCARVTGAPLTHIVLYDCTTQST